MKLIAEKITGKLGTIHFVGIGGIGMSGIAEILQNLGYTVQGSDLVDNSNTKRLFLKGIKIFIGHTEENINEVDVVVKSSAVTDSNPEIIAARNKSIPVIKRSEMLAELMRLKISIAIAGAHGKTTTTSLVAAIFEAADLSPTVINGGIINAYGTNAYLGKGDFLIAEADESDATFIKIPSTIGVITNIDKEHLDFYGTFAAVKQAFLSFIENIPFYGFMVLCKDNTETAELADKILDRKILTYGMESNNLDVRAVNVRNEINGSEYDVILSPKFYGTETIIKDIFLPVAGIHNVINSLAAIAIAAKLKFNIDTIKNGFRNFGGVKRRFTKVGEVNNITIVDDYAHHPKEIIATLKTAKHIANKIQGKVIAVFQPHRYSRLRDLFSEFVNCFTYAETLIITDIYSAGENPIIGISKEALAASIKESDYPGEVLILDSEKNLAQLIYSKANPHDLVICLGAGSITNWAAELPKELELLYKNNVALNAVS
ncbi:UDP-N-acetylmuramate--L-alanine ligase [Rickettsiales bacterium Ac37b]|nr:UDP-N-acetylmuramate--L-alanine ligase [Rickettsiales bacterium Ac37b]